MACVYVQTVSLVVQHLLMEQKEQLVYAFYALNFDMLIAHLKYVYNIISKLVLYHISSILVSNNNLRR